MEEIALTNNGRVQGGGFFKSKTEPTEYGVFYFDDLTPSAIRPDLGDAIITPVGEIWIVTERKRKERYVVCDDSGESLRGGTGNTPDIEISAEVDGVSGVPEVIVEKSGTAEKPTYHITFKNITGDILDSYYTAEQVNEKIGAEAKARADADTKYDGKLEAVQKSVTTETSARTLQDKKIWEALNKTKEGVAEAITSAVNAEAEERKAQDSALETSIKTLEGSLATEKADRASKDAELEKSIIDAKSALTGDIESVREGLTEAIDNTTEDLTAAIASETKARIYAIKTEIRDRENADSELGGRIDQFAGTIENEATTRTKQDEQLQENINQLSETLTSAISTERAERTAADTDLQGQLNSEETERKDADTKLGNAIAALRTESGAILKVTENSADYKYTFGLYNADGELLGEQYDIDLPLESVVVDGRYDAENKDLILTLENGTDITIPVEDLIDGLATEAQLADLDEKFSNWIAKAKTTIEDEISTLRTSLTEQITTAENTLNAAISTEKEAREDAVSEERGARVQADLTEALSRSSADDTEANARASADEQLGAAVSSNKTAIENIKETLTHKMTIEEVDALFD